MLKRTKVEQIACSTFLLGEADVNAETVQIADVRQ